MKWVAGPGRGGITLLGDLAEPNGKPAVAQLSVSGCEALELPAILNDVTIEALAPNDLLLRSGPREWRIRCTTWQLHRDVGAAFYRAIPPRQTPWTRRLTWRVLLGIAATSPGRWLLSRRTREKSQIQA